MNYGAYLSASGVLTNLYRQDVFANNLANSNTVAFKPDSVITKHRLPERLESNAIADPKWMLEQLGGGILANPTKTDFAQGSLRETGNTFDLALLGDGFFLIDNGDGQGADRFRLTRDGRFTLNDSGEMVMAANGMKVLDKDDQPIRLQPGLRVDINAAGEVSQDGSVVGRLAIVDPSNKGDLTKEGDNLFSMSRQVLQERRTSQAQVTSGFVESSGVDPIMMLTKLIGATKAVQGNARMMQYHDNMLGQAINTFGRVT